MKKYIQPLFLLLTCITNAQVGISTNSPLATLHVEGTAQFTKDLNVGGNASTRGNSGLDGQLLLSRGVDNAPVWNNPYVLDIPQVAIINSRSNTTRYTAYATFSNVAFNVNSLNYTNLITRTNNSTFTIVQRGIYLINAYANSVEIPNTGQSGTGTGGTYSLRLRRVSNGTTTTIASASTGYTVGNDMRANISTVVQLNTNDIIRLQAAYTREFNLSNANITFTLIRRQ